MKKIVFTVINDLSYDQRMIRICTSLANAGYHVTLIGRIRSYSIQLTESSYKQIRFKCFFNKGKLFYIEYNIRLLFFLLINNFDIYCGIDLDTILPNYFAAFLKHKPCVYDAHELFTETEEIVNRPAVKAVWSFVEKMIIPKVKYAYTVNESIAKLFETKYNKKFHIIRNVSLLIPYSEIQKDEKYILYQGDINIRRGLEETLEAMKHIDCKLYVCGKGDIFDKIIKMPAKLGIENKVNFLGRITPAELRIITQKATIGITLLQHTGLNYYYSLANRFSDFIHAATPQIIINYPEYKKFCEQYQVGIIIEFKVENIVTAANQLLSDKELYNRIKQNCLKAREIFNWQNEEKKLLEIYSSI